MGTAYAQQQEATPGGGNAGMAAALLPPVLIFLVFYLLMIRPQQKKSRVQKDMLDNLKTGDQIVTTGGLHGVIVRFDEENQVKLKIAENVTVDLARSAITGRITGKPSPPPALSAAEGTEGKSD